MSFKDDPAAENYDRIGVYYNKRTSVYHICIGSDITWEEAQMHYKRERQLVNYEKNRYNKNRFSEAYLRKC